MRVLYVEMAFGFGGSLTGLLHLFKHLPADVEPVLVTGFDARRYTEIPESLPYEVADIPAAPAGAAGVLRQTARFYRYYAAPWMRHLSGTIRRYQPDLVHTANSVLSNAPAALAGRRRGIPAVGYQKGFEYGGRLNRFVLRRGWFARHIASSVSVAERLFELGLPRERCTVMYEPVEPPPDALVAAGRDGGGPPVVAMYSILQPWKGQDVFLRAVAKLRARYREPLRVVVAGSSPDGSTEYPERLKALAAELGIADVVEFSGHVRDIFPLLARTDVAVHASTQPEPFGRVIAEAMISGVAVVATRGGGAGEIVRHEQTGLHVPMGDADVMADAVERLLRDPELRRSLGRRAREFALREFRPALHAERVVALYREVLAGRQPRKSAGGSSSSAGRGESEV
jgi:glycosyltransferase involved in cell wall biosynthesis